MPVATIKVSILSSLLAIHSEHNDRTAPKSICKLYSQRTGSARSKKRARMFRQLERSGLQFEVEEPVLGIGFVSAHLESVGLHDPFSLGIPKLDVLPEQQRGIKLIKSPIDAYGEVGMQKLKVFIF
jgi:hypothetical protein